jgi:hypothetical protein
MRIPLLISGNVQKIVGCASVRLPVGLWKVLLIGHKNSVLSVTNGQILQGGNHQVCFIQKGSETDLSIFAESV